jgi:hypothetical protein
MDQLMDILELDRAGPALLTRVSTKPDGDNLPDRVVCLAGRGYGR